MGRLTDWIRAPELLVPFVTATALPLMSELDFCLLTTIWDDPNEFEAGRLEADILAGKGIITEKDEEWKRPIPSVSD